ncbi:MAG: hypothetical protein QM765_33975 [Myxococcales bacterium]
MPTLPLAQTSLPDVPSSRLKTAEAPSEGVGMSVQEAPFQWTSRGPAADQRSVACDPHRSLMGQPWGSGSSQHQPSDVQTEAFAHC